MRGVLLVGHGSREAAGNEQFRALAARLARRLPQRAVEPCFLELAEPGVQAGMDRLVARGVRDLAAVPLFLFAANHARRDLPALLAAARRRHPGVRIHYGRPLGVQPLLGAICQEHLAAALAAAPPQEPGARALLLVGRGSSDAAANAALLRVAGLIAAGGGWGAVECAYSDVAAPDVDEGVRRCLARGVRRVVLLPYFLFKGVLMARLERTAAAWQVRRPEVDFLCAGLEGLGSAPCLVELVLAQVRQAGLSPGFGRGGRRWPVTCTWARGCT